MMSAPISPPSPKPFIGREVEYAKIDAALGGDERLISIVGPSGIGKTSLAKEVARRHGAAQFGEGRMWFCDLNSARTGEDLVELVSHALGYSAPHSIGKDQLAQALANRGKILLLLDDCQHLNEEAQALIGSWLDRASGLRILLTSLIHLEIQGARLFELGPLELSAAVALYEQGAQRVWTGRTFFSGERRAIQELVQRLDRYPLAIELAAARVKTVPPRQMLAQIDDRFALLQASGGQLNSLEEALRYSWELLEDDERVALARASIFRGGFTLEAAEEVLEPGAPGAEGGRLSRSVVDLLESLREKALVQLEAGELPRFSLYESVLAFAAEELKRLGGEEEAAALHASYFLRFAKNWMARVDGPEGPEAVVRLAAERENLLAVHQRRFDAAPGDAAQAGLAISLVVARTGAHVAEKDLVDRTVEAARKAKDPALLSSALHRRVAVLRDGLPEELERDIDEALELAQRCGDRRREGTLWADRASVYLFEEKRVEAEAAIERARSIEREVDDWMLRGTIQMVEGEFAVRRADPATAYRAYREACLAYRKQGNLQHQARGLINLSWAAIASGRLSEARAYAKEALEIFVHIADPTSAADARLALGGIEREAGRLEEAEKHLLAALSAHRNFGNRRFEGQGLWNLGLVAIERGEFSVTEARLGEAYAIFERIGDEYSMARILPLLAALHAIRGDIEEAVAGFAKARRHFEVDPSRFDLAAIEVMEGFVDLARAQREQHRSGAVTLLKRAAGRLGSDTDVDNCSVQLGSLRRILARAIERFESSLLRGRNGAENGDPPGSALILGPGAAWFQRGGAARVLLGERSAKRRLLRALAEARLLTPGVGLSVEQLFAIGWPGLEVHPTAAANRVYDCVSSLRRSSLEGILKRNADGYLLSLEVEVIQAEGRGEVRESPAKKI